MDPVEETSEAPVEVEAVEESTAMPDSAVAVSRAVEPRQQLYSIPQIPDLPHSAIG